MTLPHMIPFLEALNDVSSLEERRLEKLLLNDPGEFAHRVRWLADEYQRRKYEQWKASQTYTSV